MPVVESCPDSGLGGGELDLLIFFLALGALLRVAALAGSVPATLGSGPSSARGGRAGRVSSFECRSLVGTLRQAQGTGSRLSWLRVGSRLRVEGMGSRLRLLGGKALRGNDGH